jgi:hypothetical protein
MWVIAVPYHWAASPLQLFTLKVQALSGLCASGRSFRSPPGLTVVPGVYTGWWQSILYGLGRMSFELPALEPMLALVWVACPHLHPTDELDGID